ncbi:MAG TPA: FAD-dependent monooxygenase [Xanthobacteraceae bacterium]|nr:FAD-dependent monooxygenase [Xanthobacteraceae bacterium]
MAKRDPILIVGGGLGGLTTALALARRGWPARVLEGAPQFGAIGYGIQFGPNVFHAFDRLGLSEKVLAIADFPVALSMMDALSAKELVHVPTGPSFRARFKYPYIVVHRIDLHNILLDACRQNGAIELVPDAMVTGFEDRGDAVAVETKEGSAFSGAALVAADGLSSWFRARLIGDGDPRPSGYVAFRTIVPMAQVKADLSRDNVTLWAGPALHVVHYPLRRGTEFNIVAVFRTATHSERGDPAAYRTELEHTYRNVHPAARSLIGMFDMRWRRAVSDRDPVRHWHRGRVVLLGDAAHGPLQSLAQGAGMAIEDGCCLGELIAATDGDFTGAFRRFEAARLLRTARVQLESRAIWDFYHLDEGVARDVRNATVADWDEAHLFNCLAWLYDGPAVPEAKGP